MPNWCDNRLEITPNTKENLALLWKALEENGTAMFDTFLPTPAELNANGGWYHWNIENWGTKWNPSCTYVGVEEGGDETEEVVIDFNTAWGRPLRFTATLKP